MRRRFLDSKWMANIWRWLRRRVAEKLENPSVRRIRLYDLRHFCARALSFAVREIGLHVSR